MDISFQGPSFNPPQEARGGQSCWPWKSSKMLLELKKQAAFQSSFIRFHKCASLWNGSAA